MFNPQILFMYQQFRQNPMQMLSQKFNIPEDIDTSDAGNIIQHLLNTNQVSQQQINSIMAMKNNPMMQQFMK